MTASSTTMATLLRFQWSFICGSSPSALRFDSFTKHRLPSTLSSREAIRRLPNRQSPDNTSPTAPHSTTACRIDSIFSTRGIHLVPWQAGPRWLLIHKQGTLDAFTAWNGRKTSSTCSVFTTTWLRDAGSAVRALRQISLGSYRYGVGKAFANQTLEITFDSQTAEWICLSEDGRQEIRLPAQGLTKSALMGELSPLMVCSAYQLALPFSPSAWREMMLANDLTGTTL